jgi:SAM-dependent methyltransferase
MGYGDINPARYHRPTKKFYEEIDRINIYTVESESTRHPFYNVLVEFINKWNLKDKKCLEIGSSKGLLQNLFNNYTGVDIAENLSVYYNKKYVVASGANLPFCDQSFDAIFSYATHEHIPDIEKALQEIVRVLKSGGVCLFAPAWHTRPWFAQGYKLRSYGDLTLSQKLVKFSIPLRDFVLIRWPLVFLRRFYRLWGQITHGKQATPLKYKKLRPNYEVYWQSDSDACNSIDPFDIILWFRSRGFICHGYKSLIKTLFVRTYALELQRPVV